MDSRMRFFPRTAAGIWSNILLLAYVIFFVISEAVIGSGPEYNIMMAVSFTVVGAMIAAACGATGLVSVIRNKEKAIMVFLSTALGIYLLIGCIISLLGVSQAGA